MAAKRGYNTVKVNVGNSVIPLRGGQRLVNAFEALTEDMNLYEGVRFSQILEAVYQQGKKDGAREAFEAVEKGVTGAMKAVPHKNVGRPKKKDKD